MKPEDLSDDISKLYEQLQDVPEFENESCRKAFPGFFDKIRRLHDFNQVQNYRVVFIGEPGKGKTTAICNWLGLLKDDKIAAKRIDGVSLLATASGRTTVAEVHIRQVTGVSRLRLEYMPIAQQEAYIRDYANYYYKKCMGIDVGVGETEETDSTKSDTHIEMDRVVRNMAGLKDIPSGESDRARAGRAEIAAFVEGFADADAFYEYLLEVIDLRSRLCPEIEKDNSADFETWLSKTFRDVNDGKRTDCSIANVIYVDVSFDDLDLMLPDFIVEVIDTKGLDSAAAARMDLQELMRAEDTLCFLLDDVKSVPSDNVRNLLKRTYLTELDSYYKCKTSILVKSPDDELSGVNGADGDSEAGAELKRSEIHRRVSADDIPYFVNNTVFLDSCVAYMMSTVKEPVLDSIGKQIVDPRTNRRKFKNVRAITDYDEDAADEYRCEMTTQIVALIDRLRNRLEADAIEVRNGMVKLLEIEGRTSSYAAMAELREAKEKIDVSRADALRRFRRGDVSQAILDMAIDQIHWRTIQKMNSLYGAYEMWHTDIYTQTMQAGRECFADFIRPMSNIVHRVLNDIENPDANSVAMGCLNQYELMVKDATDEMGRLFLQWALLVGFAPQNDSNRFWISVNKIHGRGFKRMVREEYETNINDGAAMLAKAVDDRANEVIDALIDLLSEEPQPREM